MLHSGHMEASPKTQLAGGRPSLPPPRMAPACSIYMDDVSLENIKPGQ